MGVSLLSPLWPVLGNGEPLIKILGNVLTGERILQRPTPSHLLELAGIPTGALCPLFSALPHGICGSALPLWHYSSP